MIAGNWVRRGVSAALALVLSAGFGWAEVVRDTPSELPPDGFDGRQYVDSAGCVFLRGSVNGAVIWAPRLTAARENVCGHVPSIADVPTPAAGDATVAVLRPMPRPLSFPTRTVTPEVGVADTVQVRPRMRPAQPVVTAIVPTSGQRLSVPHTAARTVDARPRIPPEAPGSKQRAAVRPFAHGALGYRPAWDDDRLNPHRGKQLLSGALDTALIWTNEVPRRLIDRRSGTDVTREHAYLVYPYTDYHLQKRDLAGGEYVRVRTQGGVHMIVSRSRIAISDTSGQMVLSD